MLYATRHQVYWGLTYNVDFYWYSDLISHTHTHTHTQTQTDRQTDRHTHTHTCKHTHVHTQHTNNSNNNNDFIYFWIKNIYHNKLKKQE